MLSADQRLRVKHLLWIPGTTCPKRTHARAHHATDGHVSPLHPPKLLHGLLRKNLALKIYVPEITKCELGL
jgi:hypothetical protein